MGTGDFGHEREAGFGLAEGAVADDTIHPHNVTVPRQAECTSAHGILAHPVL